MTDIIRVELHCQSSASDGDLSPAHVARILAGAGIVWAALTDHNTIAGQEPFREALEKSGVNVVTGLEIDARSPQGPMHLLAYGFDLQDPALLHSLETLRHPLRASARRLAARTSSLKGRLAPSSRPSSPSDDGFDPDGTLGTAGAIRLVHQAGGLVFMAHPLAALRTIERLEAVLDWLQPQGLDGLEAFHKPYSEDTQRLLVDVAERRHLLVVAGSDFHGPHHKDGTSPGIDMPLEYWNRFATAMGLAQDSRSPGPGGQRPGPIGGKN
ncbi:MAG: PHP domain-containing protein [bacterium]